MNSPFRFYSTSTGELLDVAEIYIEESGNVVLTTRDGKTLKDDEYVYRNEVLDVPGYGEVPEGATLEYKKNLYVLRFGWHHNSSGQSLYSWYLDPLEGTEKPDVATGYDSLSLPRPSRIRTLDKCMIKDLVKISL